MSHADIAGKKYGMLTAIEYAGRSRKGSHALWLFECDCGATTVTYATNVKTGKTQSCGCHRVAVSTVHGGSYDPTYSVYAAMKQRCSNPKAVAFRWYGAKGVSVCDRWQNSYANFMQDMGPRPEGLTLERKNPFGNYEPDNCVWATWEIQYKNKRKAHARAGD